VCQLTAGQGKQTSSLIMQACMYLHEGCAGLCWDIAHPAHLTRLQLPTRW
jgi:hypothetical protein